MQRDRSQPAGLAIVTTRLSSAATFSLTLSFFSARVNRKASTKTESRRRVCRQLIKFSDTPSYLWPVAIKTHSLRQVFELRL